ncbi:MAG: hypothetical protein ACYTEO_17005 [Planctomycetota bacterium]|jgi:hypothetical protein
MPEIIDKRWRIADYHKMPSACACSNCIKIVKNGADDYDVYCTDAICECGTCENMCPETDAEYNSMETWLALEPAHVPEE